MSKEKLISFCDVGFCYRRRSSTWFGYESYWVMEGVSFDLYRGETLGVIGKNGAGKSTMLGLLAGIVAPTEGRVNTYNSRVSLLSLQAGFVPYLTGRENVILSAMLLGISRADISMKMDDIRSYADIGDYFERPIRDYSTGMRARLGFSVAVHVDPDVILLDEVLGVGDMNFRRKSTETMRKRILNNKTVVLVSHNANLIEDVCDRVVWLHEKKIKMIGETKVVIEAFKEEML